MAMERRPGISLVSWLESRAKRTITPISDEVDTFCRSFLASALTARALLAQVAPTLNRLNTHVAIHRDVNARNLLISSADDAESGPFPMTAPEEQQLEFSLVDFGSSVDVAAWNNPSEPCWKTDHPTGDARYWGPASWLRFLRGSQALERDPEFVRQYQQQLDIFALAVCALQAAVSLQCASRPPEEMLQALPSGRGEQAHLVRVVQRLLASWAQYWKIVVTSFEKLHTYSKYVCSGDKHGGQRCWHELVVSHIPELLAHFLQQLLDDLIKVGEICRIQKGNEDKVWAQVANTLDVLYNMLRKSSRITWTEIIAGIGPQPARHGFSMPPGRAPQDVAERDGAVPGVAMPPEQTINHYAQECKDRCLPRAVTFDQDATSHPSKAPPHAGAIDSHIERNSKEAVRNQAQRFSSGRMPKAQQLPRQSDARRDNGRDGHEQEQLEALRNIHQEVTKLKKWYLKAMERKLTPRDMTSGCSTAAGAQQLWQR